MADNGSAGSVFRDRRGENPFQPVQTSKPKAIQHRTYEEKDDWSYNGRGTRNPNGEQPTTTYNGRSFPRENPDLAGRKKALQRMGERNV